MKFLFLNSLILTQAHMGSWGPKPGSFVFQDVTGAPIPKLEGTFTKVQIYSALINLTKAINAEIQLGLFLFNLVFHYLASNRICVFNVCQGVPTKSENLDYLSLDKVMGYYHEDEEL